MRLSGEVFVAHVTILNALQRKGDVMSIFCVFLGRGSGEE